MHRLEEFIQRILAEEEGWSDLHLKSGDHPRVRSSDMQVEPRVSWTLSDEDIAALMDQHAPFPETKSWQDALMEGGGNIDFALTMKSTRFRANLFRHGGGKLGLVLRRINDAIPPIEALGLPEVIGEIIGTTRSGLILVTGETGSGKSTSLASIVQRLNETQAMHIVTLEDPVEYRFKDERSSITQREIGPGKDADTFATALRAALRQDPDIIMVGEMRDRETASIALEAAQTGHLVLGTLHTRSAAQTVERFIALFETEAQPRARSDLSTVLRAVISQVLLPRTGGGRVLGYEVMVNARGVGSVIRQGKTEQLNNEIQQGRRYGMNLLNECLRDLVQKGEVERDVALKHSYAPEDLSVMLGGRA